MSENAYGKILLVVKDSQREAQYLKILAEHDAEFSIVNSLHDAICRASEAPYSGALVDIPLMIKTPDSVRAAVEDLMNGLPSALLNIHSTSGIRILPRNAIASTCSIDQFFKVCSEFHPKIIFTRKRKPIHLNVLLDLDAKFSNSEKTVCIDISVGGCFVFFVRDDIAVGSTVWLKLPESIFDSPVECIVCWVREWGNSQSIPGIGLQFLNISDKLRNTIGTIQ